MAEAESKGQLCENLSGDETQPTEELRQPTSRSQILALLGSWLQSRKTHRWVTQLQLLRVQPLVVFWLRQVAV
jgi:hypothetical protein